MLRFAVKYSYGFIKSMHANQYHLLYSTSTSFDSFANYLVSSLDFSHHQALSTSTKFHQYNKFNEVNATCVVAFFKQHGFTETLLNKIVSSCPRLLSSNVHKTLTPKLRCLQEQGFSRSDIIQVIYVNPALLLSRVESSILPALQILRQLLVCDARVIAVFKKIRRVAFRSVIENLLVNVTLLTSYGIPIELIRKRLLLQPRPFLCNPEIFKDVLIRVEYKLGITPDAPMFLDGIHLVCGRTEESIQSKCRMFESCGWTQSDVDTFIMKWPTCFTMSNESIKKKLDFLMNDLQLTPAYLTSNPMFLTYSLEKRVMPRHKVLLILKGKGLMKKFPFLSTAVRMSEPCFLKRFVLPFKEVHEVYAKLIDCSIRKLVQENEGSLP